MGAMEVLYVVLVEGLARSPLVGRVIGHQRASRREYQRLPGVVFVGAGEGPGAICGRRLGGRQGRKPKFSSSEHGPVWSSSSCAIGRYSPPRLDMYKGPVCSAGGKAGGVKQR
jgi:hypothetical protein